jgi:hypothetical protein
MANNTLERKVNELYDSLDTSILYQGSVRVFDRTTKSKTLREILEKKLKKTKKYKKLKNLTWGFGIEHEVYFFHIPTKTDEKITGIIAFNAKESAIELIKQNKLTVIEKKVMSDMPLEYSGRKCGKVQVVEPIFQGAMPEFITKEPFNSLTSGRNPIENYCEQIITQENDFLYLQLRNNRTLKLVQKYGMLAPYPFGMSSHVKVPIQNKTKSSIYNFKKNTSRDYTGSYHLTFTLPFDPLKTSEKNFIQMHQNFGNQIQWIEPLLLTAFFSADDKAVGNSDEKRIKGSYRVMNVGWGNFAGSDVRKFNTGIGRYTNFKKSWRDGMVFYDSDKLKSCHENKIEDEPASESLISSNMRTFGAIDKRRPWHRESGLGMTKPNGIELRIFDHFNSKHLIDLCRIVVYIAENSMHFKTKKYVYNSVEWKKNLQNIMYNGWKTILTIGYIKELREHLNLKLKIKSKKAYDVFWELNNEIFEKNKKGDIPWLLLERDYDIPPILPSINRNSLDMGLHLKLNSEPIFFKKMNKFLHDLPTTKIKHVDFKKYFLKVFPVKKWKNDIDDIIYFLEKIKCILVNFKTDKIISIKLIVENINNINKTNVNILKYFSMLPEHIQSSYDMDGIVDKSIILEKLLENQ